MLSGLLLNVALYALLRFKMVVAGQPAALDPGPIMVVMGLVSLIFAAFMLYQRRDIKRLFAYSSIEHMGLIVFAFGMGGPLANFAGLLHMAMHSLTKSGIFFAVGHIAQAKGTQRIAEIKGLSVTHPRLAVAFALAVLAICGMPPFGVFASEFLILTTTFARHPWLALLPAFGLLVGFGALLLRLQETMLGRAGRAGASRRRLLAADGPAPRCWCSRPASSCRRSWSAGSSAPRSCWDDRQRARPDRSRRRPDGRARRLCPPRGRRRHLDGAGGGLRRGRHELGALWADEGIMRMALNDADARPARHRVARDEDGRYPSVAAHHPPALRLERAMRDLYGVQPLGLPDPRPWLDHGRWPGRAERARYNSCRPKARACIRSRSARSMPASSSPGHFRFTANGETVVRLEERLGYVHKGVEGLMAGATVEQAARIVGRISGDSTVAYAWAFARAVEAALRLEPRRRAPCCCAASWPSWSARAPHQRRRRHLQRRQRDHHQCPLHAAARGRAGREPMPASAIA